jgi:hypothetical protein
MLRVQLGRAEQVQVWLMNHARSKLRDIETLVVPPMSAPPNACTGVSSEFRLIPALRDPQGPRTSSNGQKHAGTTDFERDQELPLRNELRELIQKRLKVLGSFEALGFGDRPSVKG